MHLKEAGDAWTHVPYSHILSQFSFPTTSEQLTPRTDGKVGEPHKQKEEVLIMKCVRTHRAKDDAIHLNFYFGRDETKIFRITLEKRLHDGCKGIKKESHLECKHF